jgi:putative transposase
MTRLDEARDWLTVFRLPAYAPSSTRSSRGWALLKWSLANLVKRSLAELTALVKTRLRRVQYRPRAAQRLPRTHPPRPHAPL